ncbi:unnamed protein product [Symbiodinium sp. CCMP2592]|nr:unnamed protein product [Symbiodinium sp. CCMP2592]
MTEVKPRLIDALVQKIPEQSSEQPLGVEKRSKAETLSILSCRGPVCFLARFQAIFLELQLVVLGTEQCVGGEQREAWPPRRLCLPVAKPHLLRKVCCSPDPQGLGGAVF